MPVLDDIAERLVRIEVKLDAQITGLNDHESRLRALERKTSVSPRQLWTGLIGSATVLAAVATTINVIH